MQYYAYIEIVGSGAIIRGETDLWRGYKRVAESMDQLVMRQVAEKRDIFPVFRDLFARRRGGIGHESATFPVCRSPAAGGAPRQAAACSTRVRTGSFDTLRNSYDAIERIAAEELKLEIYPNRIEVITAEQMLDVYTSHGMPLIYKHWSFGKRFVGHENAYKPRPDGPRLRGGDQLKSLHQLSDGGEQRHHAGAGDCACGVRA